MVTYGRYYKYTKKEKKRTTENEINSICFASQDSHDVVAKLLPGEEVNVEVECVIQVAQVGEREYDVLVHGDHVEAEQQHHQAKWQVANDVGEREHEQRAGRFEQAISWSGGGRVGGRGRVAIGGRVDVARRRRCQVLMRRGARVMCHLGLEASASQVGYQYEIDEQSETAGQRVADDAQAHVDVGVYVSIVLVDFVGYLTLGPRRSCRIRHQRHGAHRALGGGGAVERMSCDVRLRSARRRVREEHDTEDVRRDEYEREHEHDEHVESQVEGRAAVGGRVDRLVDGIAARHGQTRHQPVVHEHERSVEADDELAHEVGDEHGLGVYRIDDVGLAQYEQRPLDEVVGEHDEIAEADLDQIELEADAVRIGPLTAAAAVGRGAAAVAHGRAVVGRLDRMQVAGLLVDARVVGSGGGGAGRAVRLGLADCASRIVGEKV